MIFTKLATVISLLPLASWAAPCRGGSSTTSSSAPSSTASSPLSSIADGLNASKTFGSYGWYEGWQEDEAGALNNLSLTKYDALIFSFAVTTPDPSKLDLAGQEEQLSTFVSTLHDANVSAWGSIGGWTGSMYFSSAMSSEENRTTFLETVLDFAGQYKLDGLDFDWEYPGAVGMCNQFDETSDSDNFLTFLQALKADERAANLSLTAAVATKPFVGASNISAFADVFDHIAIMNYDNFGTWTATTGPNAPVDNSCTTEGQEGSSAAAAVKAWSDAGFPASHIVLGVPSYGTAYTVTKDSALRTDAKNSNTTIDFYATQVKVDVGPLDGPVDQCGNPTPSKEQADPQMDLGLLIDHGYLTSTGNASEAITYSFDACSQTPFLYDQEKELLVSYDDAQSFAAKGQFIKDNKLKGFSLWHVNGDRDDILLDSIRKALDLPDVTSEV